MRFFNKNNHLRISRDAEGSSLVRIPELITLTNIYVGRFSAATVTDVIGYGHSYWQPSHQHKEAANPSFLILPKHYFHLEILGAFTIRKRMEH